MKIYIIGGAKHYASWINNVNITDDATKADIIMFTGGEDVSPDYYGEHRGKYTTFINKTRDTLESRYFDTFQHKLKIGVCRGSQFLNVMNSGKLIQHVTNHAIGSKHVIETYDNKDFEVTSTHHQMSIPFSSRHFNLIAWANKLSTTYLNGRNEEIDLPESYKEFEIGYYSNTKSLLIQSHPEMMTKGKFHNYLNDLIVKCLDNNSDLNKTLTPRISSKAKQHFNLNEEIFDENDEVEAENIEF